MRVSHQLNSKLACQNKEVTDDVHFVPVRWFCLRRFPVGGAFVQFVIRFSFLPATSLDDDSLLTDRCSPLGVDASSYVCIHHTLRNK